MMPESLIAETAQRFPRFSRDEIRIVPLEKGGSDRKYYRVRVTDRHSLILVKYGDQKEENRHYVAIAQFLKAVGISVPEIYFHDSREGLIWMEDLGELDLWTFRNEPWETRRPLYHGALDQVWELHSRARWHAELPEGSLQPPFDVELYRWEQDYFFENCLGRYFGIDEGTIKNTCDRQALDGIAQDLAQCDRVLVHRDFQSQNILVADDELSLIDFQGLREGLVQYDLASLLYDPYVALTAEERQELLDYYIAKHRTAQIEVPDRFTELFYLCAVQRLMQALGAYGFLGLVKEKPHFLAYIPAALASLRTVIAQVPHVAGLDAVLRRLPV